MHFSGIPANLLSLGALDFGIIVDGTLVMVEHMMHALDTRRRRDPEALAGESVLDTIRDAALEVERPIFFSLIIIVSAYIPLFTLERVERRLFTPMAFTVCYAPRFDAAGADADSRAGDHLFRNARSRGKPGRHLAARTVRASSRSHDRSRGVVMAALRLSQARLALRRCSAPSFFRSWTRVCCGFARTSPPASRWRNQRSFPARFERWSSTRPK
jgi:hypothetical protein